MAQSLAAPSPRVDQDSEQVKFIQRLVDSIVRRSWRTSGTGSLSAVPEESEAMGTADSGWEWKTKDISMTLRQ